MSNLDFGFTCTKHNYRYAMDRPAKPLDVAWLGCPICNYEERGALRLKVAELEDHRDLLLKAIDLKQLIQPLKEENHG